MHSSGAIRPPDCSSHAVPVEAVERSRDTVIDAGGATEGIHPITVGATTRGYPLAEFKSILNPANCNHSCTALPFLGFSFCRL